MAPEIITVSPSQPAQSHLDQAAQVLARGGLVVLPTETFYALAAAHDHPEALERLSNLKMRPVDKPFALILSGPQEVNRLATEVTLSAARLMAAHWPGPLTLVMEAEPRLAAALVSPDGGVGMRLSPHPVAWGVAHALNKAITATSANLAGGDPPVSCDQLPEALLAQVDLVLDAGPCAGGQASTLLDVRGAAPVLLRAGAVPWPAR